MEYGLCQGLCRRAQILGLAASRPCQLVTLSSPMYIIGTVVESCKLFSSHASRGSCHRTHVYKYELLWLQPEQIEGICTHELANFVCLIHHALYLLLLNSRILVKSICCFSMHEMHWMVFAVGLETYVSWFTTFLPFPFSPSETCDALSD